jgi:hypothetical protein
MCFGHIHAGYGQDVLVFDKTCRRSTTTQHRDVKLRCSWPKRYSDVEGLTAVPATYCESPSGHSWGQVPRNRMLAFRECDELLRVVLLLDDTVHMHLCLCQVTSSAAHAEA